jgi:outer membrane PBP1 activator LpoA protein
MGRQLSGEYESESESVIPFAPAAKNAATHDSADQLDNAGHTILRLLHKAAGVAEANSQHALEMAQKLSHQLRAAEDRIAELEAEVGIYQDKAERAEQWLHKVYTEIEDRFLRQDNGRRGVPGAPQRTQSVRTSR